MKIISINGLGFANVMQTQETKTFNNQVSALKNKPITDTVSFKSSSFIRKPVITSLETAKFVAKSLSTSTSGHRAQYRSELFNSNIVRLITLGVADYAKATAAEKGKRAMVIIGGDTRIATRESLPLIEETLRKQDVDVISIQEPVPTPLLAMAAKELDVDLGILMTASHNPWQDGGYNLVTKAGAIAPAAVTARVAEFMIKHAENGYYNENKKQIGDSFGMYPYDLYKLKIKNLNLIKWDNIKKSGLKVYYDGLNGTGNYVTTRLLKDYRIPFTEIKSAGHEGPNPTAKNLELLRQEVQASDSKLRIGLSNDGDADRFGVIDENGNYVNPNDIILLTAYHMAKNKGLKGTIIRSQGTSMQVDRIADKYGFNVLETPVGFKYIGEDIIDLRHNAQDILVAGEESGGLTVNRHIPEKDGILAVALIMDLIATEKKPISEILADVKAGLGESYALDNLSKKLTNDEAKDAIMAKFQKIYNEGIESITRFGKRHYIDGTRTAEHNKLMWKYRQGGDGIKIFLNDGSSVLVRKSGTEPLVKCYIEATGETPREAEINKVHIREEVNKIFES